MQVFLINPRNSYTTMYCSDENKLNRYRIFKPLGLMVLGSLTPPDWEVTLIDENIDLPDYESLPRPDLVGITAFTSQASRAYELAGEFRQRGVPVVMGGIHATMCMDEAARHVDAVVRGEAEEVWTDVLDDVAKGSLRPVYEGGFTPIEKVPPARQDLTSTMYPCPLDCAFCSVTAFNGRRFRRRAIPDIIEELRSIKEKNILFVDDNLIGTSKEHMTHAKKLFQAMIDAKVRKRWVAQVTVNLADDEELLRLAKKSGCIGVQTGFESLTEEGLTELNKKFNMKKGRGIQTACRRMQRHGIGVLANFIIGLDSDKPGIGQRIADAAISSGADLLHVQLLTPLPGTRLWDSMKEADRIAANSFPEDWKYYTLTYPVAQYRHFSSEDLVHEFTSCFKRFYSLRCILRRMAVRFIRSRRISDVGLFLIANLSYRGNLKVERLGLERYLADTNRRHPALASSAREPDEQLVPVLH